jgi:hypothetical protein
VGEGQRAKVSNLFGGAVPRRRLMRWLIGRNGPFADYLFLPLVWPHGPIGHIGDPAPKIVKILEDLGGGVA